MLSAGPGPAWLAALEGVRVSCEVSARLAGTQLIIALRGELDAPRAAQVVAASGVLKSRSQLVIFDLTELDFIDCFSLRALLEARQLAQRAGGEVLLAAPREWIHRLLVLTGFADRFRIYATVTDAIVSTDG